MAAVLPAAAEGEGSEVDGDEPGISEIVTHCIALGVD